MSVFDQIKAYGNTIVAERMGETDMTRGGLVIPEANRVPHWIIRSAGPDVTGLERGQRIIFRGGTKVDDPEDGRTFVFLQPTDILGTLPVPSNIKLVSSPMVNTTASGVGTLQKIQ